MSPSKVYLDWPDQRDAYVFKVFSGDIQSPDAEQQTPLATSSFSYSSVPVIASSNNQLKVYKFSKDGAVITSKPLRHYKFTSWPTFSNASAWSGAAKEYSGIEIKWTHVPWESSDLQASPETQAATLMRCHFLENGTLNSDPFSPSSSDRLITVTARAEAKQLLAGNAISSLTRYAVGCEMVYADGTYSRQPIVRELTSSQFVQESVNGASVTIVPTSRIFVNRALSFLVNNASEGLLRLNVNFMRDSRVENNVLNFSRSNTPQNTLVRFDTPFPSIPGTVYGGRFRVQGTFQPSASGSIPAALGDQDIYIKTADNIAEVIHARLDHIYGGQAAGKATASGDFNCDGHDDLAVGLPNTAWQDSVGKIRRSGIVIVYYGSSQGLRYQYEAPQISPSPPGAPTQSGDIFFPPVILYPPEAYSSSRDIHNTTGTPGFGAALAVGNFNRDYLSVAATGNALKDSIGGRPCMDLAIGMPKLRVDGAATPTANSSLPGAGGGVLIRYGSPSGLRNGGDTVVNRSDLNYQGTCPGLQPSNTQANQLHPSYPVANTADAISPPFTSPPPSCSGTLFYPFAAKVGHYACRDGANRVACAAPGRLSSADTDKTKHAYAVSYYRSVEFQPILPDHGDWPDSYRYSGSYFGESLATGDLNSDGYDDLAVGAPNARAIYTEDAKKPGTQVVRAATVHESSGAAFVYFGSSSGLYQQNFISNDVAATDECGTNPECSPDMYYTGKLSSSAATQASPVKFSIPYVMPRTLSAERAGAELFGQSLAISNIDKMTGVETRAGTAYTGTLWVGAPGAANRGGRVYVFRPFESVTPGKSIRAVQQNYAWKITGSSSEELGYSLASGNFRDPRFGKSVSASEVNSVGLDMTSRNRIREAVAAGAPGYDSMSGRVYVFTPEGLPAASGTPTGTTPAIATGVIGATTATSNREQQNLCDSATLCPGSILPSPTEPGSRFGERLSTLRMPLEMDRCGAQEDCAKGGKISDSSALAGKWQPVFHLSRLDSLLAGAPSASGGQGRAFLYGSSKISGLQPGAYVEHDASSISQGSPSRFGDSLAGGYFNFFNDNASLAIGMPAQSKFGPSVDDRPITIGGGGSVAVFEPLNTNIPAPQTSEIDLMLKTPNTDDPTADFFSISSLPNLGHYRARGVGDVNGDGFSDAILPHYSPGPQGTKTELLVLFGSASGLKTKTSTGASAIPASRATTARLTGDSALGTKAPQWIDSSNWSSITGNDPDPLKFFSGVGDVNGDGYDDLVVGRNRFVIVYGSESGFVLSTPFGEGRNPKPIIFPNANAAKNVDGETKPLSEAIKSADLTNVLTSTGNTGPLWGSLLSPPSAVTNAEKFTHYDKEMEEGVDAGGTLSTLDPSLITWGGDWENYNADLPGAKAPICHGDFNGDGYVDVVLGSVSTARPHEIFAPDLASTAEEKLWGTKFSNPVPVSGALRVFYGGPISGGGLQTSVPSSLEYDYQGYASYDESKEMNSPLNSKCSGGRCRPGMLFDPHLFIFGHNSTAPSPAPSPNQKTYSPFRPMRSSLVNNLAKSGANSVWSVVGDRFGELCVSVGNIDNDPAGYDDLVVPLPRSKSRPRHFVLFKGGANGLRNSTLSGTLSSESVVVEAQMSQYGTSQPATDDAELSLGRLGAAGSGLGDINRDGVADFALGVPSLIGEGSSIGRIDNGGVMLFLGASHLSETASATPQNPAEVLSTHRQTQVYKICDLPGAKGSGGDLDPCSRQNSSSPGLDISRGVLIRPDSIDDANRSSSFGLYVDAAGDVNADGNPDLLIPMPKYNVPGKVGTGAGLLYFGNESNLGHVTAGYKADSGEYISLAPSPSATCESYPDLGIKRCAPYLLTPEFATLASAKTNQNWMVTGGLVLRPKDIDPIVSKFKFFDYGSRNIGSHDLEKKSADLLLAPVQGTPFVEKPTYDHLGGLSVWY